MGEPSAVIKLCECGCGEPAPIAKYSDSTRGWVGGQPLRYIRGHWHRGRPKSPEQTLKMRLTKLKQAMPAAELSRYLASDGALGWCPRCKQLLPAEDFHASSRYPDGLSSACKACQSERHAAYRRERVQDPEFLKKAASRSREWRAAQTTEHIFRIDKKSELKRKYGISLAQFEAMLASQRHRCAICRTLLKGSRSAHVDHDHETGRVRGILCNNCNNGLGRFQDSPTALRRAARYLETAAAAARVSVPDDPDRPGNLSCTQLDLLVYAEQSA
jgi:RNase P subunit RPR2